MADSLGEARRALRRGETGEALVHLWNALEQARGTAGPATFDRIAELAERAAAQGDEGERAEAERLLTDLDEEAPPAVDDAGEEEWAAPGGERVPSAEPDAAPAPEPTVLEEEPDEAYADEEDEEEEPSRTRVALGWLIPLAIFLFITLRDVLS
jgi:hypothetical protein